MSVDPLIQSYHELTPYQFASNEPISNIDVDGLEAGGWELSSPLYGVNQRAQHALQKAELQKQKPLHMASFAMARTPVLTQGQKPSRETFVRRDAINNALEIQGNLSVASSLEPVSQGGPGFGRGLVRDPFVQTAAQTLLTGGITRFVTTSIFQSSTTSLSFSQQFLLKSSIDVSGQMLVSGPSKIDFFDAALAGLPVKPAFSALAGSMFDVRPFSNDKISFVGLDKSFSDLAIEATFKYTFGGGGIPKTLKDGYKGSFNLNKPGELKLFVASNYIIQIPFNLSGKAGNSATKDFFNEKTN